MTMFTMRLNDVIEHVYGVSMDSDDYVQEYDAFEFEGVSYGRLPVLPDPMKLGLGSYPIFDEAYRPILNGKIIDEFYLREIGQESIDVWLLTIRRKMDQIMPYYNKMYLSEKIDYEALMTMRIESEGSSESEGSEEASASAESNTSNVNKSRAVNSQFPQNALAGSSDYATNAADSNSDGTVKSENDSLSSSASNMTNASRNVVTGFQGVASDLVMRYRDSLLNVDMMVLNELQPCFMLVMSNSDTFTRNQGWYY